MELVQAKTSSEHRLETVNGRPVLLLRDLTLPGTFREEWWHTVQGERPIFFFELDDETVWGATARMLHQLLLLAHPTSRGT